MNLNSYIDLTDAISDYRKRGFSQTFDFKNDNLHCQQTGKTYLSNEVEIVEYNRFVANELNPDASIIFVIACHDGKKGYIVSYERNMASYNLRKFMDKVKIQRRNNNISKPDLGLDLSSSYSNL